MATDWKDQLAGLMGDATAPVTGNDEDIISSLRKSDSQKLHVILDKKGRKGKVATIIEGFTLDDDEVAEIASDLKRKIGTGGSSRGGEILLQGDWRTKAAELLKARGFKVS